MRQLLFTAKDRRKLGRWFLIPFGTSILAGTPGVNRFGRDPFAAAQAIPVRLATI